MKKENMKITSEQKKNIEKEIKTRYNWHPGDYELDFLAEWDHSKIPIIVALPTKYKVDFSPRFAILQDETLCTPHDENALNRIIQVAFPKVDSSQTKAIIELCLLFGDFHAPIKRIWDQPIENRIPSKLLKRKDSNPTFKIDGSKSVIEFYSYDYELMKFYDCKIKISQKGIELVAKLLD
jgi:hypothetical protein